MKDNMPERHSLEQFLASGDITGGRGLLLYDISISEGDLVRRVDPCEFCGGATTVRSFPYVCHGKTHVAVSERTPGYECDECGARLVDSRTKIQLLTRAAEKFADVGDIESEALLLESAAEICRKLATQAVPAP